MTGRLRNTALLIGFITFSAAATAAAAQPRTAFKICADPNYLPWSDQSQQGYENKIGELLASKLKLPVRYTWFPQRMGFIRNTLRAEDPAGGYKCDVVMGLPAGYELAITTRPYYYSIYTLVYVKGRGLDDVKSTQDLLSLPHKRRRAIRFGLAERNPGTLWLREHNMLDQITTAYASQSGDPGLPPGGQEQRDLLAGKFDVTIMWGPIAGYFARSQRDQTPVAAIPIPSSPVARMHFGISAGVRFGQKEAKAELQKLLDDHKGEVDAILREYGVPLVDKNGAVIEP